MTQMSIDDALRLAMEHQQAGRLGDAEHVCRAVLDAEPRNADALHLLGIVEQQRGRHEQAMALMRQAIEVEPEAAEFWHNLGNSLLALSRHDEAADAFATAARLKPGLFEARHNLGAALMLAGRSNEAADAFVDALKLNPQSPEAHNNLGLALKDQGEIDGAIEEFARATELRPSYHHAHSNRLYSLHFSPKHDAAAIYAAHRAWAERHADSLARDEREDASDRRTSRKLRIGYVSPDLRDHPVGRSMLPLLELYDREQFDVICYSDSTSRDDVSRRLRGGATEWHETAGLSDEKLTDVIRGQRIDIIVDLTLHMNRNRLLVFARKPAPVQATFVGYPATTGLRQIDYRITDRFLDPPGETEAFNSERLVRLPHSFWCYVPDDTGPEVSELPALADGVVTFGSLNNPCKMNDAVIDTWAEILRRVERSRLLLFVNERNIVGDGPLESWGSTSFVGSAVRTASSGDGPHGGPYKRTSAEHAGACFRGLFAKRGIEPSRLRFTSRQSRRDYLAQYHRIDIALDPWPYNGHMTSCDALWMGVPTVSLRGQTSVGRGGESLLAQLGMLDLLARTSDEYIEIAVRLANDVGRMAELRAGLRERMRASPLMDALGFARDVHGLYRTMWNAASDGALTSRA